MPVVPKNTLTAQALEVKFARRQRHYSISFAHHPAPLPLGPERREPLLAPRSPPAPEPQPAPAQPEGSSATSAAWRAATGVATPDDGAHEPAASTPPRHGHLSLAPEPPPAPEPPRAPAQPEGASATFAAWRDAAEADPNLGSDASELDEPATAPKTPLRSRRPSRGTLLGTSAVALTCMIGAGAYLTRADWMPVAATTTAAGTDPGNPAAAGREVAALPAPGATTEIPPARQPDPQPAAAPRLALSAASAAAQATPGLRWTAPASAPAPAPKTAEAGTPSPAPAGPAETRPVAMRGSAPPVPSPQRPQVPAPAVITVTAPPAGTTTALPSKPTPAATPPAVAAEAPSAPEQEAAPEVAGGTATPTPVDQQLTGQLANTLGLVKQIAMLVHDIQDENSKRRAQADTLQTKADALQTRGDELSKRMDAIAAENARLHTQVRVLAGRLQSQSRPVAYQPRPVPEPRPMPEARP